MVSIKPYMVFNENLAPTIDLANENESNSCLINSVNFRIGYSHYHLGGKNEF